MNKMKTESIILPEGKVTVYAGTKTPVKKFETFPLADIAAIADAGDTAIPTSEDVWYAKEFVDENEK